MVKNRVNKVSLGKYFTCFSKGKEKEEARFGFSQVNYNRKFRRKAVELLVV